MSAIITKLRFEVYLEGDLIIREGEMGTEMYFLKEGVVKITIGNQEADELTHGAYFGGKLYQGLILVNAKEQTNKQTNEWANEGTSERAPSTRL